jgi:hypothetical protein
MIRTETPTALNLWADRARRTPWIRSPVGWVRDRALDVRSVYGSCQVTPDWLEVWNYRKHGGDKGPLPPLRLRSGVLLKHWEFENSLGFEGGRRISVPMVGMDEVWRRLDQREIWLSKIGTEGAEADLFEGAPARPVKRHPDRDRGVPPQQLSRGIGRDVGGFSTRQAFTGASGSIDSSFRSPKSRWSSDAVRLGVCTK